MVITKIWLLCLWSLFVEVVAFYHTKKRGNKLAYVVLWCVYSLGFICVYGFLILRVHFHIDLLP